MIRINFIANKIEQERYAKFRRQLIIGYATAWAVAIALVLIDLQAQRLEAKRSQGKIDAYRAKIAEISPQFQQAVNLYQQRNQHKKKLATIYAKVWEPSFVVESLNSLVRVLPENFWLQKVHLRSLGEEEDDNKKQSRTLMVSGNVFLDMADENQDHIQKFQDGLKKLRPYSLAESQLGLNRMKVSKLKDRYFHDFEIAFSWPGYVL